MVYENPLSLLGCEKLYLDSHSADVIFVFASGSDENVKIPAHKGILSALSPVFDGMFFGPDKPSIEIPMKNTTPTAFKEFLQFFYLNKTTLTIENKSEVMKLCGAYKVNVCKDAYSGLFKTMLNIENMCSALELSIQFEQDGLKQICEEKIGKNFAEIILSRSFFQCKLSLLHRILQIDNLECAEMVIFDSCIAWSKNACAQKGLDIENAQNLRTQLGEAVYDIRFGEMTIEEFYIRYSLYEGFFSSQEFQEIASLIACKDFNQTKFNRQPRIRPEPTKITNDVLICERIDPIASSYSQQYLICQWDYTVFTSNRLLWLKKIECSEVFNDHDLTTPTRMKIVQVLNDNNDEKIIYLRQMALSPLHEVTVDLPTPVEIKPGVKYGIIFEIRSQSCYNLLVHKPNVEIADGIFIKFYDHVNGIYSVSCQRYGLVTRLHFQPYQEEQNIAKSEPI